MAELSQDKQAQASGGGPPHQSSEPSPTGAEPLRAAMDSDSIREEESIVPETDGSRRSPTGCQFFDVAMPTVGSDSVSLPVYAGTSQAAPGSAAEIPGVEGLCQEAQTESTNKDERDDWDLTSSPADGADGGRSEPALAILPRKPSTEKSDVLGGRKKKGKGNWLKYRQKR